MKPLVIYIVDKHKHHYLYILSKHYDLSVELTRPTSFDAESKPFCSAILTTKISRITCLNNAVLNLLNQLGVKDKAIETFKEELVDAITQDLNREKNE